MARISSHPCRRSGFTLLEFLLALGIFMALTGIVVHFLRRGTSQIFRGMALAEATLARDKLLQWLESDLESVIADEIHSFPDGAFWELPAPNGDTEILCVYLLDSGRLHRKLLPADAPIPPRDLSIESVLLEGVEEFSLAPSSDFEGSSRAPLLILRMRGEPAAIRSYL
jgi:hypothetical protein